jgi:hypothetical protein
MKRFYLTVAAILLTATFVNAQIDLKSESEKKKFAGKQFEFSMSHKANAGQTRNTKMSGQIINTPALYKDVKKIAILGVSVAFTSRDGAGSKGDNGYGGIPLEHFNELAESELQSIYKGFEMEGFSVVKLEEVMKSPSYSKLDFGEWDQGLRYSENCWIVTPQNSKWLEPDVVNSVSSGISLVHADTLKARAMKRNKPFQDIVKEVNADAGVNIVLRYYVYDNEVKMGWTPLKRGMVVDLIPASGDPRIVWSATLKSDLEIGVEIEKFDKKSNLYSKTWKLNLQPSIPKLADATTQVMSAAAVQLKMDQAEE